MPVDERVRALAADGLALARGERGEEGVEGVIAGVLPMELLVGALQVAARAEQPPFRLGQEGDVDRGGVGALADVDQRVGERRAHGVGLRARPHQQARGRSPA